jgi:hypothetical protein
MTSCVCCLSATCCVCTLPELFLVAVVVSLCPCAAVILSLHSIECGHATFAYCSWGFPTQRNTSFTTCFSSTSCALVACARCLGKWPRSRSQGPAIPHHSAGRIACHRVSQPHGLSTRTVCAKAVRSVGSRSAGLDTKYPLPPNASTTFS